jgi:hypothetical protein
MASDQSEGKPRGDRMTTDFFETVLTTYLEEDRIESGVIRLELDDGKTRRIIVDDDTESLHRHEYIERELAEVGHLVAENEDLFDEPLQLSIPVEDTNRVVQEAKEEGAVSTLFHASGIQTLVEQLQDIVDVKGEEHTE